MRRILPAFMGLALAIGAAGVSSAAAQEKDNVKVEKNGDVKMKSKVKRGHKVHKSKTKIDQHNDGSVTVKQKDK